MKKWLKYVKPYWIYFVLGPIGMIVEVVGEVVLPKLLSAIIDNGVGTEEGVGNGSQYIIFIAIAMIATAVLMLLGGVCGAYFGAKASVNFSADLRSDVYKKIQKFSFSNIDKFSTGSLVTRLTNDVTQMQNFVNMLLRMCLRSPGMLIGALIMSIMLNPKLAVILAIAMPIIIIAQFFIIAKGFPRFNKMQSKIDGLNSTIQESLVNVRVVKSFVREDFEREKFGNSNADLKNAGINAMNLMILMQPVMMLLMYATTLVVLWFGGNQVIDFIQNGTGMSVGDLTQFLTYINQILMSMMMITMLFMMWSRAMASSKRISEVLNEEPDIDDINAANIEKEVGTGDIEFKNVSFRYYKTSEEKVLNNINLKIKSGETVGIIGSTGCGKSTLVSMIPRLYDVDEGSVFVDGTDVKDYSLEKLRDGVSMVLQKNVLFSGTIEDNLKWGDQNATIDEIKKCADYAQADGFIEGFTDGYNTELGQGGVNVSGGQKQRICIARAMLKKPKIIIFDDSTSAVDTATEAKIRESFKNELKDTTKIIIAQRISSVEEANKIIVMDNGVVTGIGTHNELLESNEEYREIYVSQTAKEAN